MKDEEYKAVIGLEVHIELKTESKMFCRCSADWFGRPPNTNTCPVCLGLPGALPVPNKKAIDWCLKLGKALNCKIADFSKFDRKNYFYPDLPKGYQISQYDKPFAINGYIEIDSKKIGIRRVHMEEDTAKLVHDEKYTLIDFNRSGVPLVEIVTEPDITNSDTAKKMLQELFLIVKYLGISDASMEKGSMRLEPNISLHKIQNPKSKIQQQSEDFKLPNYKVEVKNINSFNFVKKAIDYEIKRQIEILENDEIPKQETRGWDEDKQLTYSQRSKEEAHDYRYFPEPDIPPFVLGPEWISRINREVVMLPDTIRRQLKELEIPDQAIEVLINSQKQTKYLQQTIDIVRRNKIGDITITEIANWIVNNRINIEIDAPEELIRKIQEKKKSLHFSDSAVSDLVTEVLKENPKAVADYKAGKISSLMFLLGQVMRKSKGKGDPAKIKNLLQTKLSKV